MKHFPGFTLEQFYQAPIAIPTPERVEFKYGTETVEFVFNSHGYRCQEFANITGDYILTAGPSSADGMALHLEDIWPERLAQELNMSVANLGKTESSAEFICQNITNWLRHWPTPPRYIAVQWPDAFRTIHWRDQTGYFASVNRPDDLFKAKVKQSDNYFWQPWLDSILKLDTMCKNLGIPIVHMYIETFNDLTVALPILEEQKVDLHLDLKAPGQSWHVDNGALDGIHHSAQCHARWTERIVRIIEQIEQQSD
jgi:hypothetical protein